MTWDCAGFVTSFARPLVLGGELRVAAPIDAAAAAAFAADLASASVPLVEIDDRRQEIAAELLVRPPALSFDADDLALAVALHDALVLGHPDASGAFAGERPRAGLAHAAFVLASVDLDESPRRDLVGRHGLLHRMLSLSREDVQVSWWSGSAEFRGQRPPRRLTRWAGVRRVREQHTVVKLEELLPEEAHPVIVRLLAASPLTDLLEADRSWPRFGWTSGAVTILRDAELARTVAYHWLDGAAGETIGTDVAAWTTRLAAPAAAAAAWETMLAGNAPAADVRAVTAFLVHLQALLALDAKVWGGLAPVLAAARSIDDAPRVDPGEAALAVFAALPDVAAGCDPLLGTPPDLDEATTRRWRELRAVQAPRAALLARLGRKLQRALGVALNSGLG